MGKSSVGKEKCERLPIVRSISGTLDQFFPEKRQLSLVLQQLARIIQLAAIRLQAAPIDASLLMR
jgi:hypothetical protein